MQRYAVRYSPGAERDLSAIFGYIEQQSSTQVALDYVERIQEHCEALETAPLRGTSREDLGAGFRTIGFEKRVTILFAVDEENARVEILGVFYGGRSLAEEQ